MEPINIESIKELAGRIARLAKEGSYPGERMAAQLKLAGLLKKHGLTLDDIEDNQREEKLIACPKQNLYVVKLCFQICARYFPESDVKEFIFPPGISAATRKKYEHATLLQGMFSKAEYIEMLDIYGHYRDDLERQFKQFYSAYLQVQNLAVSDAGKEKRLSPDEMSKLLKKMRAVDPTAHLKKLAQAGAVLDEGVSEL